MKATYIDYSDTGSFSQTLLAYLANDEQLMPFFGQQPTLAGFKKQIVEKKTFPHRKLLTTVLREQYGSLLAQSPEVEANITLLEDKKTFTVTTGHQLNKIGRAHV